uniref:Integrase catalytic domain-containing protein n=1 Tax=Nelumbo nucifera TaxID=4432 RepID=A0A822ZHL8_NELNU|nr:TPA_asm: hypothetical protein HUJ06_001165 [Nelumbo nucifera]
MVEKLLGHSIKIFQSDEGDEFKKFKNYLSEVGIVLRFNCPHTHAQNEVPERKHRQRLALTTYLVNWLPSPSLCHKSPFEILFGNCPDYDFLKVFGFRITKEYHCFHVPIGRINASCDVVFNESSFSYEDMKDSPTISSSMDTFSILGPPPCVFPSQPTTDVVAPPLHLPRAPHTDVDPPCAPHTAPGTTINDAIVQPDSSTITIVPTPSNELHDVIDVSSTTSTHGMQSRSKSSVYKPNPQYSFSVTSLPEEEPSSYSIASRDSQWHAAMSDEFHALL